MKTAQSQTKIYWIIFIVLSISCLIFTRQYFTKAMPSLDIDASADREQIIDSAKRLATKLNIDLHDAEFSARFVNDDAVQSYVELQKNGKELFRNLLDDPRFSPFYWQIRGFKDQQVQETIFYFAPNGKALGFTQHIPENQTAQVLTKNQAQLLAETRATEQWGISFKDYRFIEEGTETQPNGRIDYRFEYELLALKIVDAPIRLQINISGDTFSGISHYVKIPESFIRSYTEMRNANKYFSFASTGVILIVYIFIGCFLALAWLYRKNQIIWKAAALCSLVIAAINAAAELSSYPLNMFDYDTALSLTQYRLRIFASIAFSFAFTFGRFFLVLMAAEGLTRLAFPRQIQWWQLFSFKTLNSKEAWTRVGAGYLVISIHLAYVVAIYWLAYQHWGWWSPTSSFFEPNILSAYVPGILPVSQAIEAGLFEECLFRAIPLSLAALVGQRFDKRTLCVALALIAQALVFGAAHANYPQQPAYARLLELIIPSLIFGGLYLRFGLLPAVLSHVGYDLVLMSSPLFVDTSTSAWVNQLFVIFCGALPILVMLWLRFKVKHFEKLDDNVLNHSYHPIIKTTPVVSIKPIVYDINQTHLKAFVVFGCIGFIAWFLTVDTQVVKIEIDINQAEHIARAFVKEKGIDLSPYRVLANFVSVPDEHDEYILQKEGREGYKQLLGKSVNGPRYEIRFARFEGSLEQRAEEFKVVINAYGQVIAFIHQIPEEKALASLNKTQAQKLALNFTHKMGINPEEINEISAVSIAHPNRSDWKFVFSNKPSNNALGSSDSRLTILIAGSTVAAFGYSIHVPEEWQRKYENEQFIKQILSRLSSAFLLAILTWGFILAIIQWSKKQFNAHFFWLCCLLSTIVLGLLLYNSLTPSIRYSAATTESFAAQHIVLIFAFIGILICALCIGLISGVGSYEYLVSRFSSFKAKTLSAISAGFGFFGLMGFNQQSLGSTQWWADYSSLKTSWPALDPLIKSMSAWLILSTILLVLTLVCNKLMLSLRKNQLLVFGLFLGVTASFSGFSESSSLYYGFGVSVFGAALLLGMYILLMRLDVSLIPLIALPASIYPLVKLIITAPFINARFNALGALFFISIALLVYLKQLKPSNSSKRSP